MSDVRKTDRGAAERMRMELLWKIAAIIEGPRERLTANSPMRDTAGIRKKAEQILKVVQSAARRKRGRESADV